MRYTQHDLETGNKAGCTATTSVSSNINRLVGDMDCHIAKQDQVNCKFVHEVTAVHTFGVLDCALPLKKSGTDLRSMS